MWPEQAVGLGSMLRTRYAQKKRTVFPYGTPLGGLSLPVPTRDNIDASSYTCCENRSPLADLRTLVSATGTKESQTLRARRYRPVARVTVHPENRDSKTHQNTPRPNRNPIQPLISRARRKHPTPQDLLKTLKTNGPTAPCCCVNLTANSSTLSWLWQFGSSSSSMSVSLEFRLMYSPPPSSSSSPSSSSPPHFPSSSCDDRLQRAP